MKKLLTLVGAIVLVVVCGVMFLTSDLEHIEDTNGPDNYALTRITDQDIIDCSMGNMNLSRSTSSLSSKVTFSSDCFTGVYQVMWTDVIFSTGVTFDILDYEVNAGNFRMAVVNDGKIVADLKPGDSYPVDVGALEGAVSLVIAGESADFSFRLWEHDYESYAHPQ